METEGIITGTLPEWAEKLQELARQKELSGKKLASLCGLSRTTVLRALQGDESVTLNTLRTMASCLGHSVEVKLEGGGGGT